MFRATTKYTHKPMLQFRFGHNKCVPVITNRSEVVISVYDLPAKFHPLPFTLEEEEMVRFGGVRDYAVPAKKGGKN